MPIPYHEDEEAQLHSQIKVIPKEVHGQLCQVTVLSMGCSATDGRGSLVQENDPKLGGGRRRDAADLWLAEAEAGGTERVERETDWSFKQAMAWAGGDLG